MVAESAVDAYNQLCTVLVAAGIEFTTDRYVAEPDGDIEHSTEELFPKDDK